MMSDVMVDLETMGTRPGSVLRSLGAVQFDRRGAIGRAFYEVIDQASCEAVGLTVDPETVAWWERQSVEARAALELSPRPLREVLEAFTVYWREVGGVQFWANAPDFDATLLAAAYRACELTPPWQFWNTRCTRTIYELAAVRPDRTKGVHHTALADAVNQAEAVIRARRRLDDDATAGGAMKVAPRWLVALLTWRARAVRS